MVRPATYNVMSKKVLKDLQFFVIENSQKLAENVKIDGSGEDSILSTYLKQEINTQLHCIDEVTMYLNEMAITPPVSIENTADSYFKYWIEHQEIYPSLCQLALSLMYTKCTSIDVERLFSRTSYSLERGGKMNAKISSTLLRLQNNFLLFGLSSNDKDTIYDDRYFKDTMDEEDLRLSSDCDSDMDDMWEL